MEDFDISEAKEILAKAREYAEQAATYFAAAEASLAEAKTIADNLGNVDFYVNTDLGKRLLQALDKPLRDIAAARLPPGSAEELLAIYIEIRECKLPYCGKAFPAFRGSIKEFHAPKCQSDFNNKYRR